MVAADSLDLLLELTDLGLHPGRTLGADMLRSTPQM